MCCQGKPHYLTFRQGWKLTHLWYVQFNFCTVFVHHAPRVSNSCNSFPPTLLTKLAGMSLGHLVMSNYKILFFLLKLMFRLRACTEEIAYFALFAEALPQTALRISFDDISLSNYRIILKISYKYRYRIFFENITRY